MASLNLPKLATLSFEAPDLERFPCLKLAYDALNAGQSAAAVLNAANEVCVAAFLERRIGFLAIAQTIARVMQQMPLQSLRGLEHVLSVDAEARALTRQYLGLELAITGT